MHFPVNYDLSYMRYGMIHKHTRKFQQEGEEAGEDNCVLNDHNRELCSQSPNEMHQCMMLYFR